MKLSVREMFLLILSITETSAQNVDVDYCQTDEGRGDVRCSSPEPHHNHWTKEQQGVDHQLESYKTMFDENGKFKASMFTQEVSKDDYEVFEGTDANAVGDEEGAEKHNQNNHSNLYRRL